MQKKVLYVMVILSYCLLLPLPLAAIYTAPQDTAAVDTTVVSPPDFAGVNVFVETAWGTTDKSLNVDVYVLQEKKVAREIVLRKGDHQECSIELISGILVKIIDPKSGRILKQYGKLE